MDDEPELPCTPLFEQGGRGGEGGDCHGGPPGPGFRLLVAIMRRPCRGEVTQLASKYYKS